jgi:hypothetical protein
MNLKDEAKQVEQQAASKWQAAKHRWAKSPLTSKLAARVADYHIEIIAVLTLALVLKIIF